MLTNALIFDVYGSLARHSAEDQKVSAENISRVNEPGYRAEVLEPFEDYLARQLGADETGTFSSNFETRESRSPAAPNGNNVVLEEEIMRGASAVGRHDMAMSVYNKSLDLLRTALGRVR